MAALSSQLPSQLSAVYHYAVTSHATKAARCSYERHDHLPRGMTRVIIVLATHSRGLVIVVICGLRQQKTYYPDKHMCNKTLSSFVFGEFMRGLGLHFLSRGYIIVCVLLYVLINN